LKELNKSYYYKDRNKFKAYSKDYYKSHKKESAKKGLEYYHKRYKEDEGFRMRKRLGNALNRVIFHYIKSRVIRNPMQKYCIDWEGIIKQLKPFPKNRHKYHVDHIIPLFKFNLTDWEQIHIAFAPENHRWLKVKENLGRQRKD